MPLLMTLAGALLLMVAGDMLVRGAVALGLRAGLSAAIVSITIVAFGTSAPELLISLDAALSGSPDIAVGNIVGSNIANMLLIIGACAVLTPLWRDDAEIRRNYLLMLLATLVFCIIALTREIDFLKGAAMLALLGFILFDGLRRAGRAPAPQELLEGGPGLSGVRIAGLLGIGLVGLPVGAHFMVEGAREIALSMGFSEAAIGLTLVALGTSAPELAASAAAAMRGRGEIALGNVIGSNMFNLLAIGGITAMVTPIPIDGRIAAIDVPIMILATLALAPFLLRNRRIGRTVGSVFLIAYAVFVIVALGDPGV